MDADVRIIRANILAIVESELDWLLNFARQRFRAIRQSVELIAGKVGAYAIGKLAQHITCHRNDKNQQRQARGGPGPEKL